MDSPLGQMAWLYFKRMAGLRDISGQFIKKPTTQIQLRSKSDRARQSTNNLAVCLINAEYKLHPFSSTLRSFQIQTADASISPHPIHPRPLRPQME
ncbi:hypothetical protein AVEN_100855-1 [Araneus ventricosus]|uniref:Uncharacterized protein n=1 Tax=Araneus ventricosus TaxID=182803 RepID=A0A4Y2AW76_ARAVE|nr:hypothetical protein AVEN_100855-1 [Araneus ventricosus]